MEIWGEMGCCDDVAAHISIIIEFEVNGLNCLCTFLSTGNMYKTLFLVMMQLTLAGDKIRLKEL